jgi:hypothetical protein
VKAGTEEGAYGLLVCSQATHSVEILKAECQSLPIVISSIELPSIFQSDSAKEPKGSKVILLTSIHVDCPVRGSDADEGGVVAYIRLYATGGVGLTCAAHSFMGLPACRLYITPVIFHLPGRPFGELAT